MKIQNKASVIVYVLILTTLSLLLAVIVMNNYSLLTSNKNYYDIDTKLLNNINSDWKIAVEYDKQVNSDGSWYIDDISCPTNFTMSWVTNVSLNVNTSLYMSWSLFSCSGSYNWNNLQIYFNSDITDFDRARYDWSYITISGWQWIFNDWDSTKIDFSSSSYSNWDDLDDNLNSDNYIWTSTWTVNYPNNYLDNDDLARKTLFWYVPYTSWFKKVFWNNKKTIEYIDKNTNNTWSLVEKIWLVWSWALYLDIDKAYEIKLVEFNRNLYSDFRELHVLNFLTGSNDGWNIWYLQNDLTLSGSTWSAYDFNFKDKDYALFLRTTWTWTLLYKIKWLDLDTNKSIYINTIDDSEDNIISYLWNEIFINEDGQYISKQSEIFFSK